MIRSFLLSESTWLHGSALAVLLFNLDDGQLVDGILAGLVLLPSALRLLLRDPSDHLEDVIVGVEALLKVAHEVVWSGSVHCLLHPQELVRAEKVVELDYCICNPVHLLIDLLLLLRSRLLAAHATSRIPITRSETLSVILNRKLHSCLA